MNASPKMDIPVLAYAAELNYWPVSYICQGSDIIISATEFPVPHLMWPQQDSSFWILLFVFYIKAKLNLKLAKYIPGAAKQKVCKLLQLIFFENHPQQSLKAHLLPACCREGALLFVWSLCRFGLTHAEIIPIALQSAGSESSADCIAIGLTQ